MYLSEITNPSLNALLLEANVLNVKDLYNDTSIVAYARQYAEAIGYQPLENLFVKKFSKLMVNDERYHAAVRELPDNAPEWAKEAHSKRELVYFQPTDELNDKMAHVSHYLVALRQDSQDASDNNKKVFAEREINGFPKIGDLDTIVKKSEEYFKRGSGKKQEGPSEEGMTMIADVGGGDRWFILQSNEAFRREGKTLQNCIGGMYTLAKSKQQGYSIIVMRTSDNDTVVAARIINKSNSIDEMKGKNNKPPIDRYMGGVLKLFRTKKLKLKIGNSAVNDFRRSGYFYIDNELYTRNEAVKKYVKTRDIAELDGKQLIQISMVPAVAEIVRDAYPAFRKWLGTNSSYSRVSSDELQAYDIFELRDGTGHASISTLVKDKEVVAVHRNARQVDVEMPVAEAQKEATSSEAQALFAKLFSMKLVNKIGGQVSKDMFWSDRLQYDEDGNLSEVKFDKVKHDKKGHEWEHYNDKASARTLHSAASEHESEYKTPDGFKNGANADPHSVYMQRRKNFKGDTENVMAVRTKSGKLIPVALDAKGEPINHVSYLDDPGYKGHGKRDKKSVNSIVSLANEEKLQLPRSFKHHNGIVKNDKGDHEIHVPNGKETTGTIKGMKYDLSKIEGDDRWAALRYLTTHPEVRGNRKSYGEHGPESHHDVTGHDMKYQGKGEYGKGDVGQDETHDGDDITAETSFRGKKIPDSMYIIEVEYGADKKHKVAVYVTDKKITTVDGTTGKQEFQHWDDFEKIAGQLNTFAEENGLTVMRNQLMGAQSSKELRTDKGEFTTGSKMADERHQRMINRGDVGLEGTDTLPLGDGTKIVRLTPDEQTEYLRKDLEINSTPGQAWKVVKTNGDIEAAFFVKKDEVQSIFSGQGYKRKDLGKDAMPTSRGIRGAHEMHAVKAAAKAFGWTVKKALHTKIGSHVQDQTNMLLNMTASGRSGAGSRSGSRPTKIYAKLEKRGMISTTRRGSGLRHTLTNKGRNYVRDLKDSPPNRYGRQTVNNAAHWDHSPEAEVHSDFVMPDKKKLPKKEKRAGTSAAAATPRTGSKAAQALDLFRQHTVDNDAMPARADFMRILQAEPFNMGAAGASTYYANTKKKYAALNEKFSLLATWELMAEPRLFLEDYL